MQRKQLNFLFLNIGHFLDHLFMLIFATAAALQLTQQWELSYAALIPYATPSFIAFGLCAVPAGWLADKWSREGMMVIFFIGIGVSSVLTGMASNPWQIGVGLTLIGMFAAIYHPVGLAMVVQGREKTGVPLAVNGIFGNLGVASAALLTGFLIDYWSWRSAFIAPGIVSIALGALYLLFISTGQRLKTETFKSAATRASADPPVIPRNTLFRMFAVILVIAAIGGIIFQSTTFALPKVFAERLTDLAGTATLVGWYAFLVFSIAAFAQLVVGYLVDNYALRMVFACVVLLQVVFFAVMMQMNGIGALIVAIAFMLVVFGQIPITDVLVGRIARSEWRSRAYALKYIVGFSVSATAVPLIAWVHGSWGFSTLFALLAVAASLIFVAVLLLPKSEQTVKQPFPSAA